MLDLIRKAQETHDLSRDELTALLSANDAETIAALFHAVDTVRKTFVGDEVRSSTDLADYLRVNRRPKYTISADDPTAADRP